MKYILTMTLSTLLLAPAIGAVAKSTPALQKEAVCKSAWIAGNLQNHRQFPMTGNFYQSDKVKDSPFYGLYQRCYKEGKAADFDQKTIDQKSQRLKKIANILEKRNANWKQYQPTQH